MQFAVVLRQTVDPLGGTPEMLGDLVAVVVQCHFTLVQAAFQLTLTLLRRVEGAPQQPASDGTGQQAGERGDPENDRTVQRSAPDAVLLVVSPSIATMPDCR